MKLLIVRRAVRCMKLLSIRDPEKSRTIMSLHAVFSCIAKGYFCDSNLWLQGHTVTILPLRQESPSKLLVIYHYILKFRCTIIPNHKYGMNYFSNHVTKISKGANYYQPTIIENLFVSIRAPGPRIGGVSCTGLSFICFTSCSSNTKHAILHIL